jgi:hypothetical protein
MLVLLGAARFGPQTECVQAPDPLCGVLPQRSLAAGPFPGDSAPPPHHVDIYRGCSVDGCLASGIASNTPNERCKRAAFPISWLYAALGGVIHTVRTCAV